MGRDPLQDIDQPRLGSSAVQAAELGLGADQMTILFAELAARFLGDRERTTPLSDMKPSLRV